MTICLYSGTPGSGKSLHVTDVIRRRLAKGLPVICNYDLRHDLDNYDTCFNYCTNDHLSTDFVESFAVNWWRDPAHKFGEDKILLVVDEAQLIFNSRDWSKPDRRDWLSFFSQHRKYGYMVILVAQYDRMIDRQIRALTEYEFIHRKVSNFGMSGWFLSLLGGGRLFVCVQKHYGLNQVVGRKFFLPRKRVLSMYDSYAMFNAAKSPDSSTRGDLRGDPRRGAGTVGRVA